METYGSKAQTRVPAFSYSWTDPDGVVHERQPGTKRTTRCGLGMHHHGYVPMVEGCAACVQESLKEWALNHDCKASGCTDHLRER